MYAAQFQSERRAVLGAAESCRAVIKAQQGENIDDVIPKAQISRRTCKLGC